MTAAPVIAPQALRDLDAAFSFMGEDDALLDGAFVPVSFFSWMVVYVVDAEGPARILRVIDACREAPGDVSAVFGEMAASRVSDASAADDEPVRIEVFVSPELADQPMGGIDRRPDESDEQYDQRARTVRTLFGER